MIIMTLRGARNNPLMSEGAGGAEVPKALFYMREKAEKSGEKSLKSQNKFLFSSPYLRTPLFGILYKTDYL